MKMFSSGDKAVYRAAFEALDRSQAIIQFDLQGTILDANSLFLKLFGYSGDEIVGSKHAMFVEPAERDGAAYRAFWGDLREGKFRQAEFKRIGKSGKPVWIQATYNPLLDKHGKPWRVIKFAVDITSQKLSAAFAHAQIDAINRSNAVIEFELDGRIVSANENFLHALGYRLDEIKGQHHSMFVDARERDSADYRAFWAKLGRGEFVSGDFRRIGKGGKEVWIQGSYNPILDLEGKLLKVVKIATDMTDRVTRAQKRQKIYEEVDQQLNGITESVSPCRMRRSRPPPPPIRRPATCRRSPPAPRSFPHPSRRSRARSPTPATSLKRRSRKPRKRATSSRRFRGTPRRSARSSA